MVTLHIALSVVCVRRGQSLGPPDPASIDVNAGIVDNVTIGYNACFRTHKNRPLGPYLEPRGRRVKVVTLGDVLGYPGTSRSFSGPS